MMKCHQVLKEHIETAELIKETKEGLVRTRIEIEKEIDHSKETIQKYKHIITENQQKLQEKVFKLLQENHYIDAKQELPKE
jgi:tRNA U34 5-carboxymethylaminomethyl modifying GTPase MnmE/TrmE